ncbi:hypothetical protein Zmor_025935 [Zophobas morio]|uniref:Uncharacterized protein n=1 Tax=Zophobas morio TaxID=2755281 RepID=A0AA38HUF1_9CUCU|nr:hypothetical protein Zmor_025935 [Zophobas morio]
MPVAPFPRFFPGGKKPFGVVPLDQMKRVNFAGRTTRTRWPGCLFIVTKPALNSGREPNEYLLPLNDCYRGPLRNQSPAFRV